MKLRGRTTTRLWSAPAAVVALCLLSGCGELPPSTASVVNGTRITHDQVTDLSDAQCTLRGTLAESGTAPATSIARVNQESLSLLMDAELSLQFGEEESVTADTALTQAFFGQVEPVFEPLPEKARTEFTNVFQDWSKGRAILVAVGSKATGQDPSLENLEQLLNAGLQARQTWLDKAKIETNPLYGPDSQGFPTPGSDGSVSRPVSDFAKGGSVEQPDAEWVTGLPASQKCG